MKISSQTQDPTHTIPNLHEPLYHCIIICYITKRAQKCTVAHQYIKHHTGKQSFWCGLMQVPGNLPLTR